MKILQYILLVSLILNIGLIFTSSIKHNDKSSYLNNKAKILSNTTYRLFVPDSILPITQFDIKRDYIFHYNNYKLKNGIYIDFDLKYTGRDSTLADIILDSIYDLKGHGYPKFNKINAEKISLSNIKYSFIIITSESIPVSIIDLKTIAEVQSAIVKFQKYFKIWKNINVIFAKEEAFIDLENELNEKNIMSMNNEKLTTLTNTTFYIRYDCERTDYLKTNVWHCLGHSLCHIDNKLGLGILNFTEEGEESYSIDFSNNMKNNIIMDDAKLVELYVNQNR